MAVWDEPEEVVDLSLVPGGRRYPWREGAVAVNPGGDHDIVGLERPVLVHNGEQAGPGFPSRCEEPAEPGARLDAASHHLGEFLDRGSRHSSLGGQRGLPSSPAARSRSWLSCDGTWTPKMSNAPSPSTMDTTIQTLTSPFTSG